MNAKSSESRREVKRDSKRVEKIEPSAAETPRGANGGLRAYVSFVMDERDAFGDWSDELYDILVA